MLEYAKNTLASNQSKSGILIQMVNYDQNTINKIENGNGECVKETTTRP